MKKFFVAGLAPERKLKGQSPQRTKAFLQISCSFCKTVVESLMACLVPSGRAGWSISRKLKNCSYTSKTVYRKFETNISRNETLRPFLLQQNKWTDHGNIKSLTDPWMWELRARPHSFISRNTYIGSCLQCTLALLSSDQDVPTVLDFCPLQRKLGCFSPQSTKELPWLHEAHVVLQMVKSTLYCRLCHIGELGEFYLSTQRINTCEQRDKRGGAPADCWNGDEWMGTQRVGT
jgi:hypothetical protein